MLWFKPPRIGLQAVVQPFTTTFQVPPVFRSRVLWTNTKVAQGIAMLGTPIFLFPPGVLMLKGAPRKTATKVRRTPKVSLGVNRPKISAPLSLDNHQPGRPIWGLQDCVDFPVDNFAISPILRSGPNVLYKERVPIVD